MMPLGNFLIGMAICLIDDENNRDYKSFVESVRKSSKQAWYPIIIANPQVPSEAAETFFRNYSYLNVRTGNVRFYVPGLISKKNEDTNSRPTSFLSTRFGLNDLMFEAKAFARTIEWLENECKGYKYSEGADLILLQSKEGVNGYEFDYGEYLYVDLDAIKSNLNRFLQEIKRLLEKSPRRSELIEHLNQYSKIPRNAKHQSSYSDSINVFIAGSVELLNERNQVRSQLQQINNAFERHFVSYTYEDFNRDVVFGGRQQDYDEFISNQADYAVFIIDINIGGITFNEFEVAINSFMANGHPKIFVYHNKGNLFERIRSQPEIKRIIELINEHNQYYIQYRNVNELGHLVYQDFSRIRNV